LSEDPGFFEAFVSTDPNQVLIRIYAASDSARRGEIDPVIDHVLQSYKKTLVDAHNVKTALECLMPDIQACLND